MPSAFQWLLTSKYFVMPLFLSKSSITSKSMDIFPKESPYKNIKAPSCSVNDFILIQVNQVIQQRGENHTQELWNLVTDNYADCKINSKISEVLVSLSLFSICDHILNCICSNMY